MKRLASGAGGTTERIKDEANQYLTKLAELQKKYAMRMPTVADRLAERFIRPLTIDRIRALVAPAIDEAREGGESPKFEMLQHDTECLTREPTGVGFGCSCLARRARGRSRRCAERRRSTLS